jgi:hypothetical protein
MPCVLTIYKSSTLYPRQPEVCFHITHPFSPDCGKEFILIERKKCWGEDRLLCFDENGKYRTVLTSWTDYEPPCPFVSASNGTAFISDDHALELSDLLCLLAQELSI